MASPPAAWDCRVVPSPASNAEPVDGAPRGSTSGIGPWSSRTTGRSTGSSARWRSCTAAWRCAPGGQRKRALLARLLLEANRTVSIDALVDALWGERVPSTAVKMVHIYVSQLRKVLPSGALQTRPPGYRLEVAPEAVDLLRFERLRKEGREALADGDAGHGGRASHRGVCALARARARRVLGAVRRGGGRTPRGAAAARRRGPGRRGARPRPPSRRRGGAAEPRGEPPAPRAPPPPADAGAVPAGKARRGARGLPGAATPRSATSWGSIRRPAWPSCSTASSTRIRPSTMPRRRWRRRPRSRPRCPCRPPATDSSAGRRSWRGSSRRSTPRRPGTARPRSSPARPASARRG